MDDTKPGEVTNREPPRAEEKMFALCHGFAAVHGPDEAARLFLTGFIYLSGLYHAPAATARWLREAADSIEAHIPGGRA